MFNKKEVDEIRNLLKGLPLLNDKDKIRRVNKAKKDFWYAVKTYFPHHIDNIVKETSEFRKFVYTNIEDIFATTNKASFEAYRGAAKSTVLTRLYTIWKTAIQNKKRHTVIISSTLDVSKETLDFIKTELEDNERLKADFDIQIGTTFKNTWNEEEIIFKSSNLKFRIKVYGAGKKIRGANWLGFRPDLIICDDIEDDEAVESKKQRDKLWNWFTKAILKLPARKDRTYTLIVVGTRLHHDGFLAKLEKRNDFKNFSFPLVVKFPDNLDDLVDENSITKEVIKDTIIDDTTLDIKDILLDYLEDRESFMSELQNQPLSKDGLTFSYTTFEEMPHCDTYSIGVDPALGKAKGDYFGVTVLGYSFYAKKFYATTKMYKIKATLMIDKLIETYNEVAKFGRPIKIAIEEVQFQEFFKDVLDDKAKELGIHLPIVPIRNGVNKELRIDGLAPLVNKGDILINKKSLLLIDELDTYPKAPHDDGLDSLEMAYRIAKKSAFNYTLVNRVARNFGLKGKYS